MPLRMVTSLVAVLTACAGAGVPDAGSPDASVDGGPGDAGHDAGRDGGATDGGSDAGADAEPWDGGPDDPSWVRLPGLPEECPIERAEYPERIWSIRWVPCTNAAGDEIPGCTTTPTRSSGFTGAWNDEGEVWLRMIGGDALGEGRIVGIGNVDGRVVAAWREPPRSLDDPSIFCLVTARAVGGGRAAFVAQFANSNDMSESRAWLYMGTPDSIGSTTDPVHEFPASFVPRDRTIIDLWISEELLALQASPDGSLYSYRDGEWATLTGRGTVEGLPQNVDLVGDHLLWEAWRGVDDVRLVHARWGEAASVWRDIGPSDTKGSGTDGLDIGWFDAHDRQSDGSYGRTELWTAPYRRDLENVEPRLVRVVDERCNEAAVGGGWIACRRISGGPQRVEVYSLRDGSRRTFVAPGGTVLEDPYYARERDIMFPGAGTEAVRFDPTLLPVDP